MSVDLRLGDCVEILAELEDASVDAVVTDPPYGINFMGKAWDGAEIERAAREKQRDVSHNVRLTGSPDSPSRRLIARTGSAFQNAAGEAGAYDFSVRGNRAFQSWCEQWGAELLRVLKPGGHALVFGGTRTHHRLTCALEEVGFEIRDELCWMYGSGFPKSLDVSKAIDKAAGAEREVVGENPNGRTTVRTSEAWARPWNGDEEAGAMRLSEPATPDAQKWDGWGTALKPAHEPIVVARKPLVGTVARNVLEHGTGAINVDGCRVPMSQDDADAINAKHAGMDVANYERPKGHSLHLSEEPMPLKQAEAHALGRWPANVVLDEEAAALLDEQTGELASGSRKAGDYGRLGGSGCYQTWEPGPMPAISGDSGGASRFYYVAKASRAERNAGLDGFEATKRSDDGYGSIQQPKLDRAAPRENWSPHATANSHPTVKPIALMRWLVRLVTPPGGLVLDPFLGSGTTGVAAVLEGFRFLGVEREPDYLAIAEARIRFWEEHGEDGLRVVSEQEAAERRREEIADAGQLDLLDAAA